MITAETLRARPGLQQISAIGRATWLAPAAAGVFAGAALFDLLPSAAGAIGGASVVWAVAGLGLMTAAALTIKSADRRWIGWAAGLGIWLHSILEGVAAGTGYGVSTRAGVLMSVGLVIHLIPESLALFVLVTQTGGSLRRAMLCCAVPWVLVVSGFAGSRLLVEGAPVVPLGRAMAFGGGTLLCLALLSWNHQSGSKLRAAAIAAFALLWVAVQHLG